MQFKAGGGAVHFCIMIDLCITRTDEWHMSGSCCELGLLKRTGSNLIGCVGGK